MALFFSLFVILKYNIAAFIFYLLNLLATSVIIIQLLKIFEHFNLKWEKIKWPLILSLILSLRYFWTNFDLGQINAFIFILILAGFYYYLKNKFTLSTIFFSLAAVIKIIPVIFLFWLFLKRFNLKNILIPISILAIFILLPFPFRGFHQSMIDLGEFYHYVIYKHLISGEIFYRYTNQSLDGFIGRLFLPPLGENLHVFPYLNLSMNVTLKVDLFIKVIFTLLFVFIVIKNRVKKTDLFEISFVVLFMHLISSLTWKNHLVTTMLVFFPLFYFLLNNKIKYKSVLLVFIIIYLTLINICVTTIIGLKMSILVGSYHLIFLMLLSLFIVYMILIFRNKNLEFEGN